MKNPHSSVPVAKSLSRSLVLSSVLFAVTLPVQSAVLVAWDVWGSVAAADDALSGFTATIAGNYNAINGTIGSTDGTYGSGLSGADTAARSLLVNNTKNSFTLTLTNNTGFSYSIDTLRFDYFVRNTSPRDISVVYTSGGLGTVGTTIAAVNNSPDFGSVSTADATDYDYSLSSLLTDTILSDGESAVFTFTVSDNGNTNSSSFDNIAFEGSPIPEPSAALLGGLGLLALLRRRR